MRPTLLIAVALGLSLAATASAKVATGSAENAERALMVLQQNEPGAEQQTIEGEAVWRLADYGLGPAIEALIRFPTVDVEVIMVIEPNLSGTSPQYSHRASMAVNWPGLSLTPTRGLLQGVIVDGAFAPFAIANEQWLLMDDLEENLALLRSRPNFVAEVVGYDFNGGISWPAGGAGAAVIEAALAAWAAPPPEAPRVGHFTDIGALDGRYGDPQPWGEVLWERLEGDLAGGTVGAHFYNGLIDLDLTFAITGDDLVLLVAPTVPKNFLPTPGPVVIRDVTVSFAEGRERETVAGEVVQGGMLFSGETSASLARRLTESNIVRIRFGNAAGDQAILQLVANARARFAFQTLAEGIMR